MATAKSEFHLFLVALFCSCFAFCCFLFFCFVFVFLWSILEGAQGKERKCFI